MHERRLPVLDPTRDPAGDLYAHVPSGWFDLIAARDLPSGAVRTVRLGGEDVVVYRTERGEARAVGAHCPHMGAHLGRGGAVRGDAIVCPFHGFEFGAEGRCTKTGYGTPPPPKLRAIEHPVHEIHGVVFGWHGAAGEAPSFRIPHHDDAIDGFHPMLDRTYELRGHPQETNENSVDVGHFPHVHGYRNVRAVHEIAFDRASLSATYAMDRPALPRLPRLGMLSAVFEIHMHGLGYSRVEVSVPKLAFRSRHFVFATPIERGRIRLRCGFSLARGSLALPFPLGGGPGRALAESLLMQIGIRMFVHDVAQDFEIWSHKRYLHPPQLAVGDGLIGVYRWWARQFYPSAATDLDPAYAAE
jgi:nitrite reductase/ring-hydroxylating ferredoxin subunit